MHSTQPVTHRPMQHQLDLMHRHLVKVIESSDDAIVSKDLNGIVISWNRAAERIFGYTAEEMIGRSIRQIIPDDRQSEEDEVLAKVRQGQAVTNLETIRRRKDGSVVPISLTVSPIYDDEGRVAGASKIARDISDRRRADVAARRLAAVVKSSDDAIITKNLDSIVTSWNLAAERMFGYTEQEMIGRSIRTIIPADLQGEEDDVLAKIRAGETLDHYETTRRRKDGSLVTVSLTVSPLRDDAGLVVGASKIARDITEQVRLRAQVLEHATNTHKLSEVGARVAATLDHDTIVQEVTEAATALTGAELGAFFYSLRDSRTGDAHTKYVIAGASKTTGRLSQSRAASITWPTFHGDATLRIDDLTQDPQGGEHPPFYWAPSTDPPMRSYLAVPVKAPGEDVVGGLIFGHSRPGMFTEEHERLVAGIAGWASLALRNARLYVDARDANRMKDEFLAVLSHELRTPLNAIVGYARLLRGGILRGEKAARGLDTLERNATALTQIVEDVLDVSRIVAGKIRLDVQPVDLPLVVDNAVATVQPAADAKGVRLQTIVDPRVGPVSGDPDRLQQVVWNLLANAVKFTPKGGRVHVRLERVNSHTEIIVSDTGQGIRPDFLPYVFERFRQAEGGTTRKTGGLGLGLAIVRHIVEMHGGTVHAASAGDGAGATFTVRLPLMIVQPHGLEERREHPRTERSEPVTQLGDLSGVRVLAIDDEEDALMLLRVVLEAAGAEVTPVANSSEGLQRIQEVRPHVIVMDLGMPGMDGFELIGRIRASNDPYVRDVPAAALTAFARSEDRTKALRSGFEMHLAKPVDPGELVASVATLVRRTRTTDGIG